MAKENSQYQVRVVYDVRSGGETFGPLSEEAAEACLIALASRQDVRSATIEIITKGGV